ncbi:hypothetical protein AMAG_12380 [Allomyces macrogynus ATCC 38327]|uniref:Uncharacterized protein n=1 Tax=Allomyces macrogynus (strain ATCC 38327) TaxID=578462 RepID=A0A0L0SY89_ALLM3|nr:hypothetical protein AMAG_12380 [Allomyces macrogynus ATCC 38327]|eukprot:KNE67314.1 hypothetical protein AMAG_12380 [Allomyces macrogynus ATCC 38327]
MTLSVSVKTPISSQPVTIEMLKADGSNWMTFADHFLSLLTEDQLKLKSYKVLVDSEYEVVSLEQQEEMTDVQFKKLIELDLDVKFVADAIYWNSLAAADHKKCMAHNSYKAKSCIQTIIKVVLPSAIASELLQVFSDATCVADVWVLLHTRFDKRSAQAHLANVKALFTKPMSGSGAAVVHKHIADLQCCYDVIWCHEHAKLSSYLCTDFADSFLVLALLSKLLPEYLPMVLSLGERYEEIALMELQMILC